MEKIDELEDIKIVQKLSWLFNHSTGINFQDLYAEALLAYSECLRSFKKKEAKFSTWTYINVKNALINYTKKEKKANMFVELDSVNLAFQKNPYWELRQLFSDDAKFITDGIIENPYKYLGQPPKMIRGQIVKELREEGWAWSRVWNCINEIKNVLN